MTIFGQKFISILCLVNLSNGIPAQYNNDNSQPSTDESRHFPRFEDSGFIPIIPPPHNPHPILSLHSDPHLNPILEQERIYSSHYRNGYLSTSRPFSLRHISSTATFNRLTPSTRAPTSTSSSYDQTKSILGSGDFTVLRGGTFYPEGEEKKNDFYGSGSTFFDSNNGRPFALPLEQSHYSDDPFASFKDFADITAGVDSDFTNIVVIYANKNSTKHEPRNILEQLQLLDQQKESESENHETEVSTTSVPIKNMKLSKFKTKLLSTKPQKVYFKKVQVPNKLKQSKETKSSSSSIDYVDPLVADS
ncbi:hypothetical protein ACKWTF_005700 [Chironomus riparius]